MFFYIKIILFYLSVTLLTLNLLNNIKKKNLDKEYERYINEDQCTEDLGQDYRFDSDTRKCVKIDLIKICKEKFGKDFTYDFKKKNFQKL